MSRKTYPTQLRDHSGNEVRLPAKPFATGGEGAVFDVVGRPDLVAKLYSKPQSKERCEKLRAMAKLCNPDLLKIAAWPTATLSNSNPGVVEGILMPRIADHMEIHHLYSVAQRKKDFPDVDWGFLLHTARNCAIAFESIHRHGHIVGDVNQKNVMVSKKGIIALVDCDSFQVKEGNRIFRCGVGVPEYTPPELHGRKFIDVDRDANHDLFGLAVMVFHLLMMGRHPFAGVPQVNIDIPIEKAIQDGLYAYTRNPTKLKPPPHVPPLVMLDAPTRDLFERAFNSHQRPTATEWRSVLDSSMKGLQRCKNDPRHSYPMGGNCPWCQLIATARLMFFIPSQGAVSAALRIEDIRNLFQKLNGMQMVFTTYLRPRPILPIEVTLPVALRAIQKPSLLPHPAPPRPIPDPVLEFLPPRPVFLGRPVLRPLPAVPAIPLPPKLSPHPSAPVALPHPKLHDIPLPPDYPPLPLPAPPDLFLERLCAIVTLAGIPMYLVAPPVSMIVMFGCGAVWLIMKLTEGMRDRMAQESLKKEHQAECDVIDQEYKVRVQPIELANREILKLWESANAAKAAEHVAACKKIDDENRRTIAPWEARKAAIMTDHQWRIHEVEQANRKALADWEAENAARRIAYDGARHKIEVANQRLTSAWEALTASRQAEYRQKCDEIDAANRRRTVEWEAANAPWIVEQKRWYDRVLTIEAEIKQMERELAAQRNAAVSKIQQRKAKVDDVQKSHNGALQDYERDLRQAEMDSKKTQLDEHLDKSMIRGAKLKGITGDRILCLESFGIETAKDVSMLNYQKVPGIGPVLSRRLFDWRDRLASSFRSQQGLPESERRRVASRYAPVLLPLGEALQSAINDLEGIAASHLASEAQRIKAIAAAVQELAVAETYVRAMNVM
ncbi:hypothetical protein SH668x_001222 [Planctomicrobium sp. SH668]|uniref:hypothetical protein n=1 Tax=Planctomicrobium sp. SH668 TaxID=3448126 RepID=UPI003F5C0202